MLTAAFLIAILIILLLKLSTKSHNYWRKRGLPHEKPKPFFGNIHEAILRKRHLVDVISRLYNKFQDAPYFGMYILNRAVFVVKKPEIIKQILVTHFDKFIDRPGPDTEQTDPVSFFTLFSVSGKAWKSLRSKLSPVFTSGKLKLMFPLVKNCCDDFERLLSRNEGATLDIRLVCTKLSVDVIASCAFGINSNCLKSESESEILQVALKLLDPTRFRRGFSIFTFFFVPKLFELLRLTFADQKSSDYLMEVFKVTYKERQQLQIVRNDLMDHLHALKRKETPDDLFKFDDTIMASQAISFFSAGNDSISVVINFALYELALNLHVQTCLREEISKYEEVTYESVQNMKYLNMVVSETLRKYPVKSYLNRLSTSYHFHETDFTLESDINVLIPILALQMDDRYFPDPNKFDPERFNDENKFKITPFTYLPFGEGPRICLGQRFALLVIKVALVCAIKKFDFRVSDETLLPIEFDKNSTIFLQPKCNKLFLKVARIV